MRDNPIDMPASPDCDDAEYRLGVPADCTRSGDLDRLLGVARRALAARPRQFVLDLRGLRAMNCQLLSAVIYLGRECMRAGVGLVLDNVPAEFEAWVSSHRLTEPIALVAVRRARA